MTTKNHLGVYTTGNLRSLKTCPALQLPVSTPQNALESHLENLILASLEETKYAISWRKKGVSRAGRSWRVKTSAKTLMTNFHKRQKANTKTKQTKVSSYLSPQAPGYINSLTCKASCSKGGGMTRTPGSLDSRGKPLSQAWRCLGVRACLPFSFQSLSVRMLRALWALLNVLNPENKNTLFCY